MDAIVAAGEDEFGYINDRVSERESEEYKDMLRALSFAGKEPLDLLKVVLRACLVFAVLLAVCFWAFVLFPY